MQEWHFFWYFTAMNPEEIDSILLRLQAGVDLAMQRAKAWSKYMKEITTYIEKKTQLGKLSASDKTRIVKNNCVRYFIFFLNEIFLSHALLFKSVFIFCVWYWLPSLYDVSWLVVQYWCVRRTWSNSSIGIMQFMFLIWIDFQRLITPRMSSD